MTDITWGEPWKQGIIHIQHAIGCEVNFFGEPGDDGNWLIAKNVEADKRHDFVFQFNDEQFELTGVEMLEALRAFKERKESGVSQVCAEVDRAIAILSRKDDE